MSVIKQLFNVLAPHECLGCQKEGNLICYDCGLGLASMPPRCYKCGRWSDDFRTCAVCRKHTPIHSLWAVTKYEGLAKELLHELKFGRARAGAEPIARMLAEVCAADDVLVTFVPTASRRVRQRGYDQAELIARALARQLGLPCLPCLLRVGQGRQLGNSRRDRQQQMQNALRAANPQTFQNKHVLVIDDVLTTGATCEAAARVLRAAGAKRVSAAVFAVA